MKPAILIAAGVLISLPLFGQVDLAITELNTASVITDTQTLRVSGTLGISVRNIGTAAVSTPFQAIVWEDRNNNLKLDSGEPVLGSLFYNGGVAPNGTVTIQIQIPLGGAVLFRNSPIAAQVDSANAIVESNKGNNTRSTTQNSQYVKALGSLDPVVLWNKNTFSVQPDSVNVMMTPVVADLDGDGFPEIIFNTYTGDQGYDTGGQLRAIHGRDGSEVWTNTTHPTIAASQIAVGDIDGDGKLEIIAVHESRRLVAFNSDGTFKWLGPSVASNYPGDSDLSKGVTWGAPSISDLDGDGKAEIVFGATIVNSDGTLRWTDPTAYTAQRDVYPASVVVDLNLDGKREVVTGRSAYRADGSLLWRLPLALEGTPAIGNFNNDPFPEIVLSIRDSEGSIGHGVVYLLDHTGAILWGPVDIPGGGGGPPTIADFDGDGIPDIGVAGANNYVVFNRDGTVKWTAATQDRSSFFTGSSVFDFDGDGKAEVVYGDELNLHVFRGGDGFELFRLPKSSCTAFELPVIADVNGDSHAEIVVGANTSCGFGPQNGIFVIGSKSNSWVNTRRTWNQHAYHVTNVNDDGSIPRLEQANWLIPGLNNFRQNTFLIPNTATSAPDLTSSFIRKNDAGFPSIVHLTARIGNGGANNSASTSITVSVPGTSDPWLAGMPNGASASTNDVAPAQSPLLVRGVPLAAGAAITFSVSGCVSYLPGGCSGSQPRGGDTTSHKAGTENGMASLSAPVNSLVGIFLDDSFPNATPAPAPFVTNLDSTNVAPSLKQVFFIGDGKTAGGSQVSFVVPAGATRLFLGTMDGEEWSNDSGSFAVTVTSVAFSPTVAFYRGDPASGGTLIGTTATSKSLAPGEFEDVSVTWNSPPAGLHPIVVVVDPDNLIAEGDETNNKAGANILLGVGPFITVDDLTARFKDKEVDLRWSVISGASGYKVYRRTGAASPTLIRGGGTLTSLADTTVSNGAVYYYSVRWLDPQGKESGDGTEASATPSTASTTNTAPTILSTPVVRATALTPYSYQVRASDPDLGDALTYAIQSPPEGMTISAIGLINWTPTTLQGGYSRIQVFVQDKKGNSATQSYYLFVDVQIVNQPPVITSTPITLATSGQLYGYQVLGRDPQNGLLFYGLDSAPGGMTINQSTGLVQWTPTRAQVGSQSISIHLTNFAGLSVKQDFTISVARGNTSPHFTSIPVVSARASQLYSYQAAATDAEGDPITFSLATAPSGLTVNPTTGLVQWTPTAAQVGSQTVSLRVADDSGSNSLQNFAVTVRAADQSPAITSTAITSAQTSTLYSYQVVATDPDLPNDGLTFALIISPAGMTIGTGSGLIQWTPAASSLNTIQNVTVQVKDLAGATATQSFQIKVGSPDTTSPTVSIGSPANGAQLTNDTAITGTADDTNLKSWVLEYQVSGASVWSTLSTGTSPVVNGLLGTLPATLLANNPYRLRLTAADSVQSNSTTIEVNVNTGQLKLGDFTLNFEDIRVPGFTFPISILRKYDSKRFAPGDFGPGWTLGFSEVDVRTNANNDVFMTLPDGRRVSFTSTPYPIGIGVYNTAYTAQGGVVDALQNLDCPQVLGPPGNFLCNGFQAWNPQNYLLTTKDGLKYTINAQSGIQRIEDRIGNFIQITTSGVTSNFGRNITFKRDSAGKITSMTDPTGGQAKYSYDSSGRLAQFTDPAGNATTFSYENPQFPNYLTKIVDPLGRPVTKSVYDTRGRLLAQCDANGNITTLEGCVQFTSQPVSQILTTLNGRGFKTDLFLDAQGNVLTERHWLDSVNFLDTVRTYDVNNNTLTEKDPAGNTKLYKYDTRNNKLSETDQGGHTTMYTYNACDKVATQTDPAGNITKYAYDSACNLRFVTDALNSTTEYRYNAAGQRTQFIDSLGSTWIWAYAPSGLLTSLTDPFGKATAFHFNSSGDLLNRTDRMGRQIDFEYDADHHLVKETWSNGHIATFGYSPAGQLTSASDPDSALTMIYDSLGRLQSIDNQGTPGAPRVLVSYTYDQNGNVTGVMDSLGGTTAYNYDPLDRLSQVKQSGAGVQEKRVDMQYDTASILTQLRRFGDLDGTIPAVNTLYSYDCGGCTARVSAIRHRKASDNSVLHDLNFVRDTLGDVTSSIDAEGTHNYTYDLMRRLTSATHPVGGVQPNEFYTYDVVGNRLTSHLSHFYTYSLQTVGKGNRLLQDNQFNYVYDDEGNVTAKTDRFSGKSTDYTYDFRNRMIFTTETTLGVQIARFAYAYDAFNRRIKVAEDTQTSFFTYDNLNPLLQITGGNIERRLYTPSLDYILSTETNEKTQWLLTDQVGTVRNIVASDAFNRYTYDSFGALLKRSTDADDNNLLFTGREFSPFTGLGYFRARYYDSKSGRFLAEDPIQEPFSYPYVDGHPLAETDPLGLLDANEDAIFGIKVGAPIKVSVFGASRVYNFGRFINCVEAHRPGSFCASQLISSQLLGPTSFIQSLFLTFIRVGAGLAFSAYGEWKF